MDEMKLFGWLESRSRERGVSTDYGVVTRLAGKERLRLASPHGFNSANFFLPGLYRLALPSLTPFRHPYYRKYFSLTITVMASLLKKPLKLALVQLAAGAYDCYLTPSPPPLAISQAGPN